MINKNKRVSYASKDSVDIDVDYDDIQNMFIQDHKLVLDITMNRVVESDYIPILTSNSDNYYYIKGCNDYVKTDAGESLYYPHDDSSGVDIKVYQGFENNDHVLGKMMKPYVSSIDYLHCGKTENMYSFFGDSSSASPVSYVKNMHAPHVTYASSLFTCCGSLRYVDNIDFSNCDNNSTMFYECTALQSVTNFKIKQGANCERMFQKCSSLQKLPDIDYHKIGNAHGLFSASTALNNVEDIDLSSCTAASSVFYDCTSISSLGVINVENATTLSSFCSGCTGLKTIKEINSPNAKDMSSMFYGCRNLTKVERLNVSSYEKGQYASAIFYNCASIKHVGLVSTNPDTIRIVATDLTPHPGAAVDAYIIDISMNSQEVIDALSDLAVEGWTIKTSAE